MVQRQRDIGSVRTWFRGLAAILLLYLALLPLIPLVLSRPSGTGDGRSRFRSPACVGVVIGAYVSRNSSRKAYVRATR